MSSDWLKSIFSSFCSGQRLPMRGQKMSKSWLLNHFWDDLSVGMAFQMMERMSPAIQKR